MDKVTPSGLKIARLRKSKGFKQFDFAQRVGMSIRKYRDIETKSTSISQRELQEIADKLSDKLVPVSAEELTALGSIARIPPPGDRQIQLRPVDGTRLLEMAQTSDEYEYQVLVPVGSGDLGAMLSILRIVKRNCGSTQFIRFTKGPWADDPRDDGFDEWDFPELRRMASLNDAIEKLKAGKIGILGNTYAFRSETDIDTRLCIAFVESEAKTLDVMKAPDAWKRPALEKHKNLLASFTRELDDEVPF